MKKIFWSLFGLGAVLVALSGCSTHPAMAGGGEPHAVLRVALAEDVTDTRFPGILKGIDGEGIIQGRRREFWLKPGIHELSIIVDVQGMSRFDNTHSLRMSPEQAEVNKKTITVDFEAGKTYVFGAEATVHSVGEWQPFVVEK